MSEEVDGEESHASLCCTLRCIHIYIYIHHHYSRYSLRLPVDLSILAKTFRAKPSTSLFSSSKSSARNSLTVSGTNCSISSACFSHMVSNARSAAFRVCGSSERVVRHTAELRDLRTVSDVVDPARDASEAPTGHVARSGKRDS